MTRFFAVLVVLAVGVGDGFSQTPLSTPPKDVRLIEKPWEQLGDSNVSDMGRRALEIAPKKWRHAETDHFVLHFRRVTEAQKVAREVESYLWFTAQSLGASPAQYARKSHVFVFEDDAEWKVFLSQQSTAPAWASSFAAGDELFLNVRTAPGANRFDSQTLAHETTHAVVARLYPARRWPLWLNEGFAEYMGGASVAARKNQTVKRHQDRLFAAELPLDTLFSLQAYPTNEEQVTQLYQTSEKFVRFLFNELPGDRFVKFVEAVLNGRPPKDALLEVYADKLRTWDDFERKYSRFTK